jgi:hypothetical protein
MKLGTYIFDISHVEKCSALLTTRSRLSDFKKNNYENLSRHDLV